MSNRKKYQQYEMDEDYDRLEWDFLRKEPLDKKSLKKLHRETDSSINF